jgi:hypothetical protein
VLLQVYKYSFTGNGGLQHWSAEDSPFAEHLRWFPTCAYVRLAKGEEFFSEQRASGSGSPMADDASM